MGSGVRTGVASKECAKQGLKCHGVQKMRMLACQRVHGGVREIGEGWGLEIEEGREGFAKTLFYLYLLLYICMFGNLLMKRSISRFHTHSINYRFKYKL